MPHQLVGIAMSGGVDSTAAALILKKNHQVHGFFMDLGQPDFAFQKSRVETIAKTIGIPLTIIDLKKPFNERVLDYFSTHYFHGKTPNPCMICNRHIKFGLFLDTVLSQGMSCMATGHYARIAHHENECTLHTGVDERKDQSYFLARLTQQQLSSVQFPLGSLLKNDVYNFVESQGFTDFRGSESQDVCFLKDQKLSSFLKEHQKHEVKSGKIISVEGAELGTHGGLFRYTIGQRRGLGLVDTTPWYVCSIDYINNHLVVGKEHDLRSATLSARSAHWINAPIPDRDSRYSVRVRYTHPGAPARLCRVDHDVFTVAFDTPQRAIAPGQFAVLYDGDKVIGSGEIIDEKHPSS